MTQQSPPASAGDRPTPQGLNSAKSINADIAIANTIDFSKCIKEQFADINQVQWQHQQKHIFGKTLLITQPRQVHQHSHRRVTPKPSHRMAPIGRSDGSSIELTDTPTDSLIISCRLSEKDLITMLESF